MVRALMLVASSSAPTSSRSAGCQPTANSPRRSPSSMADRSTNSAWLSLTSTTSLMFLNGCEHVRPTRNRREFIRDAFCGIGGLALASLVHQEQLRAGTANPLAPQAPPAAAQDE